MTRLYAFIGSLLLFAASQTYAGTVDTAQRMLNQLGYNAGAVDGAYGKKTRGALEAFYADNGGSSIHEILQEKNSSSTNSDVVRATK